MRAASCATGAEGASATDAAARRSGVTMRKARGLIHRPRSRRLMVSDVMLIPEVGGHRPRARRFSSLSPHSPSKTGVDALMLGRGEAHPSLPTSASSKVQHLAPSLSFQVV